MYFKKSLSKNDIIWRAKLSQNVSHPPKSVS